MTNKKLEDEIEDQEVDLEEDELEESEEAKEESSDKKESEEEEVQIEDSEESEQKEEGVDEDREAIRARRRREKKMKREKDRRHRELLEATVVKMAQEINALKQNQGTVNKTLESFSAKSLESEQKELQQIYSQANAVMKKAIAEADGDKFAEAKAIADRAFARFNVLETKKTLKPEVSDEKHEEVAADKNQAPQFDKQTMVYANAFIRKNSSWYDPKGQGRETKIVQAIDADLYEEGYDPASKDYWEELEARAAEVLPHRFKKNSSAQKAKVTVGGSGKDSNPSSYKTVQVPKEFLQTLKAAGYEQGSDKFKAAVKQYYAQQRKGA